MQVTAALSPWLLLIFSLPSARASQRVEVWRKLQRYGALPLRSSGYVLPNDPANQEKLEWLATAIRNYKGQASVVRVESFDDLPDKQLRSLFVDARTRDYEKLLQEIRKAAAGPQVRSAARLSRLRRQFQEIVAIDFFESPIRRRVEAALAQADAPEKESKVRVQATKYSNKQWLTRPRPGIDRVSSAWLIRKYIDPRARFLFDDDPGRHPAAIPFDTFVEGGFGHRGEDCTFETLCKEFGLRDRKLKRMAQIIHDADLDDEKFGRTEGVGLHQVLKGWAQTELSDSELLQRGMDLIEGLYLGAK